MGSSSALPPISPRDLLLGTCLRFDPQDRGLLGVSQLRQVMMEDTGWDGSHAVGREKENATTMSQTLMHRTDCCVEN